MMRITWCTVEICILIFILDNHCFWVNAWVYSDLSWYHDTFSVMHWYSCTLYYPISSFWIHNHFILEAHSYSHEYLVYVSHCCQSMAQIDRNLIIKFQHVINLYFDIAQRLAKINLEINIQFYISWLSLYVTTLHIASTQRLGTKNIFLDQPLYLTYTLQQNNNDMHQCSTI